MKSMISRYKLNLFLQEMKSNEMKSNWGAQTSIRNHTEAYKIYNRLSLICLFKYNIYYKNIYTIKKYSNG